MTACAPRPGGRPDSPRSARISSVRDAPRTCCQRWHTARRRGCLTFTVENTVEINRPVAEVFAYAADPLKTAEWRPNVLEIIGYEPPLHTGTTYELAENMMGRKVFGQRVTDFQQDSLVVIETTSGSVRPVQRFTFETISPTATRYTARLDITTHGFMRVMEPLFRGQVRKRMVEYGENLKRNIEALPRP